MFERLGLQLYTVRDYMQDEKAIDETFEKLAKIGYTEAQTAGNYIENPVFVKLAEKHGIKIVGTHYDFGKIVNSPCETMKYHDLLGTKNVGIGGMPSEARKDYDSLMKFIGIFNKTAEIYAKNGFRLTYHNHSFEFVRVRENRTVMDFLFEEFDKNNISFVLDTCWVAHGGADVRYWIKKLSGRIDILHLKDIKACYDNNGNVTQRYTEVGNGNLYWDGIIEAAEDAGVKNYVVEQDGLWENDDPFESLKISGDFIRKYMGG